MGFVIMELFFLVKFITKINFFFLIFSLFFSYIVFYGSKIFSFQFFNLNSSTTYLKNGLIMVLFGSFGTHILCFWTYCNLYARLIKHNLYDTYSLVPGFNNFLKIKIFNFFNSEVVNITFSFDFFGFLLLTLAYIVGFFSLFALDTRLYWKNIKFVFFFNVFIIIVFLYVSVSNLFLFFLCYELLLIPSFLIVYYVSPSRRAIQASLYFVIWTQIGSFLVLCVVAYLLNCSGGYDFFFLKNYSFTSY